MSFDMDSIDCGFVPGTGWPEPGGFLPREALALASKAAAEGIRGMELVEVSPPCAASARKEEADLREILSGRQSPGM